MGRGTAAAGIHVVDDSLQRVLMFVEDRVEDSAEVVVVVVLVVRLCQEDWSGLCGGGGGGGYVTVFVGLGFTTERGALFRCVLYVLVSDRSVCVCALVG